MKRSIRITLAVLIALGGVGALAIRFAARRATADSRFHGSASVRVFDPNRDGLADLHRAEVQATNEHKNILIDVGGNWCPSCIRFDQALRSDTRLRETLEEKYVLLHVNWSSENQNEQVLKPLLPPHGYPALYVLDPSGTLLIAQETGAFEETFPGSDGYDHRALERFLTSTEHNERWAVFKS